MKYIAFILLLPLTALSQEIQINWQHTGNYVEGFRIYTKTLEATEWTLEKTIVDATTRATSYTLVDETPRCFALTSYNVLGESDKATTLNSGDPACLGKANAPIITFFSAP